MENKIKISQLPLETTLKEDSLIAIVQDNSTKAIKSKDLLKEVDSKIIKINEQLDNIMNNSYNVINILSKKDLFIKQEDGYNITSALQTIIDEMETGTTIFIPNGSYYINKTIRNDKDIVIKLLTNNAHFTVGGWITNCSCRIFSDVTGVVLSSR